MAPLSLLAPSVYRLWPVSVVPTSPAACVSSFRRQPPPLMLCTAPPPSLSLRSVEEHCPQLGRDAARVGHHFGGLLPALPAVGAAGGGGNGRVAAGRPSDGGMSGVVWRGRSTPELLLLWVVATRRRSRYTQAPTALLHRLVWAAAEGIRAESAPGRSGVVKWVHAPVGPVSLLSPPRRGLFLFLSLPFALLAGPPLPPFFFFYCSFLFFSFALADRTASTDATRPVWGGLAADPQASLYFISGRDISADLVACEPWHDGRRGVGQHDPLRRVGTLGTQPQRSWGGGARAAAG